jgi:uncharacterized protein DUF4266
MKNNSNKRISLIVACGILFTMGFTSCKPVKEYQKSKINDSEMALSPRKVQKTEMSFQTYREGASGGNSGKVGGGCGCN